MVARAPRLIALICGLALLAAACASGDSGSSSAASADGEWPVSGEYALVDGSQIELGDLEGQDLVLWFWAPW